MPILGVHVVVLVVIFANFGIEFDVVVVVDVLVYVHVTEDSVFIYVLLLLIWLSLLLLLLLLLLVLLLLLYFFLCIDLYQGDQTLDLFISSFTILCPLYNFISFININFIVYFPTFVVVFVVFAVVVVIGTDQLCCFGVIGGDVVIFVVFVDVLIYRYMIHVCGCCC